MNNTCHTIRRTADAASLRTRRGRGFRGFTLLEVMFAIMILGVGLIAVASLFPVATRMQKNTFDDLIGMQITSNAKAKLLARGIAESDLASIPKNTNKVYRLPGYVIDYTYDVAAHPNSIEWTDCDRSFPVTLGKLTNNSVDVNGNYIAEDKYNNAGSGYEMRTYFWEPLVRYDTNTSQWEVYVIVFKRIGHEAPNIVAESDSNILFGEMAIKEDDGTIVMNTGSGTVSSGTYWHATNNGKTPTTVRVFKLTGDVVR